MLGCGVVFLDLGVGRGRRGGRWRGGGSGWQVGGSRWGVLLRGGGVLRALYRVEDGIGEGW